LRKTHSRWLVALTGPMLGVAQMMGGCNRSI